jgi:hypothetical protein
MGRGSLVAEENLSQRGAVVDGDADGAAAAGSSGNASESLQPHAQSTGAHSMHATRRRSQRAAAAASTASMVQDATDPDSSLSASESDVTQDDADLDAHADSGSDAIAETDTSAYEVQMQVLVRTRVLPCHQAALASASVGVHAWQSEPAQQAKQGAPQRTGLAHTCTMRCRQLAIAGCTHAALS